MGDPRTDTTEEMQQTMQEHTRSPNLLTGCAAIAAALLCLALAPVQSWIWNGPNSRIGSLASRNSRAWANHRTPQLLGAASAHGVVLLRSALAPRWVALLFVSGRVALSEAPDHSSDLEDRP